MYVALNPSIQGNYNQPKRQKLPEKVKHTVNITVNQRGEWTAAIPKEAVKSENQAPPLQLKVASLDPGVKCFQTIYTTDGYVMECGLCINILSFHHNHCNICISGNGDDEVHLARLRRHADQLQRKMNEVTGQKRRRRRRALLKINQRIRVSASSKFKINMS